MKKIPGNLLKTWKNHGNMEFCQSEKVGTLNNFQHFVYICTVHHECKHEMRIVCSDLPRSSLSHFQ